MSSQTPSDDIRRMPETLREQLAHNWVKSRGDLRRSGALELPRVRLHRFEIFIELFRDDHSYCERGVYCYPDPGVNTVSGFEFLTLRLLITETPSWQRQVKIFAASKSLRSEEVFRFKNFLASL